MASINFRNISTSGFDNDALTTATPGDLIVNFGRLTTTGDLANGIFACADDVSILNFGRIETSGLGAAGIFADGDDAHIDNLEWWLRTARSSIPVRMEMYSIPKAFSPTETDFISGTTVAYT